MQSESATGPARPPAVLPKPIKDALGKARVSWLKNTEVAQLLCCHKALGFEVSQEAPDRPQSAHKAVMIGCRLSLSIIQYLYRRALRRRKLVSFQPKDLALLSQRWAQLEEESGRQNRPRDTRKAQGRLS